ncbi:hypothetical protein Tco_0376719, partial [Tanacetum coccineum]
LGFASICILEFEYLDEYVAFVEVRLNGLEMIDFGLAAHFVPSKVPISINSNGPEVSMNMFNLQAVYR